MKKIIILAISMVPVLFMSCAEKKALTFDKETSMKTLINASDDEIKELYFKEAKEKYSEITPENVEVEYILRDKENEVLIIKSKMKENN